MLCSLSTKLDQRTIDTLRDLEKELDRTLLAFSCYPVQAAEISKEQLTRIQKVEKELGLSLVAVSNR